MPPSHQRPILFIDHAAAIGGAENSLLMLMRQLDGWQPQLATVEGTLARDARDAGVPVHIVPLPRLRKSPKSPIDLWRGASAIAKIAHQIDAQALYTNTIRAQTYGVLAARISRKPLIWHMRDFWLSENRPKSPHIDTTLKHLFITSSRIVIANSHATAAHLPKSAKVHVVHNGIEIGRFDPTTDGTLFRQSFNIPLEAPLIGMMGRMRPWKGQLRFLQMAAAILRERPETYFAIIGGSPFGTADGFEQLVHATSRELDLTEHVRFAGHQSDTEAALAALDIFVHPGDPEPFGLVNIEAMAMAKPVVALKHGALPEIVVDNKTGLLVSADELPTAILDLLDNVERCHWFGQNGRQHVIQQFTMEQTVANVAVVLQNAWL